MLASGRCVNCGLTRETYARLCDRCAAKQRARNAAYYRRNRERILRAYTEPGKKRDKKLSYAREYSRSYYQRNRERILSGLAKNKNRLWEPSAYRPSSWASIDIHAVRQLRTHRRTWKEIAAQLGCTAEGARQAMIRRKHRQRLAKPSRAARRTGYRTDPDRHRQARLKISAEERRRIAQLGGRSRWPAKRETTE